MGAERGLNGMHAIPFINCCANHSVKIEEIGKERERKRNKYPRVRQGREVNWRHGWQEMLRLLYIV